MGKFLETYNLLRYMRQVLGPGALGRPRGIRWRRRWEGGSGWGFMSMYDKNHYNIVK